MNPKPSAELLVGLNFEAVEEFVGGDAEFRDGFVVAAGPEGAIRARFGDWIQRWPDGSFSVRPAVSGEQAQPDGETQR